MGTTRPTNEKIQIGDIFTSSSTDECSHSVAFYQVVGKRARTLVELRFILGDCFVDETCDDAVWEVRVRPLPDHFSEKEQAFTVRVGEFDDGRQFLQKGGNFATSYYWKLDENCTYRLTGDTGACVREQLKKEGKLLL